MTASITDAECNYIIIYIMRNLKIDELFVGAWVRKDIVASAPVMVCGLRDDGKVSISGGEDVALLDVCPVQIDEISLRGFGFEKVRGNDVYMKSIGDIRMTVSLRWKHGIQECKRVALTGRVSCWNEEIRYMHELQRWWTDRVLLPYDTPLILKWVGVMPEKEEL